MPSINKKIDKYMKSIISEFDKGIEEIDKKVESMKSKFADADLFDTFKDDDGNVFYSLNDLEEYNDTLDEYSELLDELRQKGVPDTLITEIANMNLDDAIGFMQQLNQLDDEDFTEYLMQ